MDVLVSTLQFGLAKCGVVTCQSSMLEKQKLATKYSKWRILFPPQRSCSASEKKKDNNAKDKQRKATRLWLCWSLCVHTASHLWVLCWSFARVLSTSARCDMCMIESVEYVCVSCLCSCQRLPQALMRRLRTTTHTRHCSLVPQIFFWPFHLPLPLPH